MTAQHRRKYFHKSPRLRMRPWLINLIENGSIPGLIWIDKDKKIFRIPWKHGSRQNWRQEDANLFILWAQHRGKFNAEKEKIPNTKKFKATFRCALNSLPDCEEVAGKSQKSGHDAFKIYKFNDSAVKRKIRKNQQKEEIGLTSKESSDSEERFIPVSETCINDGMPRLEELFEDSLKPSYPNGGYFQEILTVSREPTAQDCFHEIETSYYLEETHELSHEEEVIAYAEEITIASTL